MAFFNSAVGVLQTLVIALGAGLGIWGAINLLEGCLEGGGYLVSWCVGHLVELSVPGFYGKMRRLKNFGKTD